MPHGSDISHILSDYSDYSVERSSWRLEEGPGDGQAGHYDGYHRHQFDEDVERGAGGVFEGVAYGVANYGRFVDIATLAPEVAFLDIFLCVIPCAACVGHEDGEHEAG